MVSITGLLNKAFSSRADAGTGVAKSSPEILTRVTGSYTRSGELVISAMSADEAIRWYERVGIIFRCVDLIATTQQQVPIILRDKFGEGGKIEDDHLYRLLNVRPNDYESSAMFRYRLSSILLLDPQGCLIEIQRSQSGQPVAIHIVSPGTWKPFRDATRGIPQRFVDSFAVRNSHGVAYINTDDALWIRAKPHPSDPYSQMTPLMAARLAAETDFFARLFNRNFLVNDGRPGLLVAVKGQISEEDAEELRRRFQGGYTRAGQTTVIESDGLEIKDLASSPRDIQWDAAVNGSKQDLMLAFGTPESVLGNASGRTFNNADAEWGNFWELTMRPHCDAISGGMDALTGDTEDDIRLIHDYETVPVLQLVRREKELFSEERWKSGAITLNEHLEAIGKETIDEPYANVRFLTNNIIAGPLEIAKQVAELPVVAVPSIDQQMDLQQRQMTLMQEQQMQVAQSQEPLAMDTSVTQLTSGYEESEVLDAELLQEEKVLSSLAAIGDRVSGILGIANEFTSSNSAPYNRDKLEGILEGLITYWNVRQGEIVSARLDHSKFREGTRFWEGQEKKSAFRRIDVLYPVESGKWVSDLRSAVTSAIESWVSREVENSMNEMKKLGIENRLYHVLAQSNVPVVAGEDREEKLRAMSSVAAVVGDRSSIVNAIVTDLGSRIELEAQKKSQELIDAIDEAESDGASLEELKQIVADKINARGSWSKSLAVNLTTQALEGARENTFSKAQGLLKKTWRSRHDEKTRPAHLEASGLSVPANGTFTVGGFRMRYPGDPEAPLALVINCRCWLDYSV